MIINLYYVHVLCNYQYNKTDEKELNEIMGKKLVCMGSNW